MTAVEQHFEFEQDSDEANLVSLQLVPPAAEAPKPTELLLNPAPERHNIPSDRDFVGRATNAQVQLMDSAIKQAPAGNNAERDDYLGRTRQESLRRLFRVYRMLDDSEQQIAQFDRLYQDIEVEARHRTSNADMADLLDMYTDHPAVTIFDTYRRASGNKEQANIMQRTAVIFIDRYTAK